MRLRNASDSYGAVAQTLHWTVMALVLVAWLAGQFGDDLPRSARAAVLSIHISAGLAVIAFVIIRLAWRLIDAPPPPEVTVLGRWAEQFGQWMHYALYVLLLAAPAVGIVVQFARGNALPVFGLIEIASPWSADRAFAHNVKEVHEALSNALVILAALHVAAALAHHWVLRDRTLVRMLPGPRR
jgi:cytochrome b561